MKKKGFTLVELLAVIAILAILVIIALPNVMGMFNNAKKSSFETEIKNIIKYAGTEWMTSNGLSGAAHEVEFSTAATKISSLDSRAQLKYYVKLDSTGKVKELFVQDGTFWYAKQDSDQIKPEKVVRKEKKTSANTGEGMPNVCGSGATITWTEGKPSCWPTQAN